MKVLILGARAPACLEWARAFAESGWQVILGDSLHWPLARFSRSSFHYIYLPEAKTQTAEWLQALNQTIAQYQIDWLIPTCEEVFYLAAGAAQLNPGCQLFASPFELLQRLHHKGQFASLTEHWPVAAPATQTFTDKSQIAALLEQPEQWVFKPAYSRFASQTLVRPKTSELNRINPSATAPWVAQKFIAGREHCSFSILHQGALIAHAVYHPRYRVGKGSGIYFEVTQPPEIEQFVCHFGAQTGFTGQVGFDFMEDASGKFFVLECNPRATSGIHLFDDQHRALIDAFANHCAGTVLRPTPKARMVSLAMLLFAAAKHGHTRQFWRDFGAASDVIYQREDKGPLLAQLPGLLEICSRALSRRCSLLAAATADIEWDGNAISPVGDKVQSPP